MKQDWSESWEFWKEGERPKTIDIPHDAMIHEQRRPQSNNGARTGYFPGGKYFYEKVLTADDELLKSQASLHFDGVYRHATIRLNGEKICFHAYGYTPFDVSLTGKLKKGDNTVQIEVDNSYTPNSRWYSGSGIFRPVSLCVNETNQLEAVWIKTVSHSPAKVEIIAAGEDISVDVSDAEGNIVYSGGAGIVEIPSAKLWSAEKPNLYTAIISSGGDKIIRKFGIRKLEWDAHRGLLVNGNSVKLRGCCLHSDNGILGASSFADAEERKVRILKQCGYNAIRSAHNPASELLLEACDKLGLYVMDELYDGWYVPKTYHDNARDFEGRWQEDLDNWIQRDKHHPSVIMYSIGNEVNEPATPRGVQAAGEMCKAIRANDDTRPITCGINVMLMKWNATFTGQGEYKKEHLPDEKVKDEFGGSAFFNAVSLKLGSVLGVFTKGKKSEKLLRGIGEHLDIMGLNYGECRYDEEADFPRLTVGAETLVSRQWYNWPRVESQPNLIGDFVWTGFDYLGEADIGHWGYEGQTGLPLLYGAGTVDITGKPNAQMAYQQTFWKIRETPYIGVRPLPIAGKRYIRKNWLMTDVIDSWTWHGYEGKKTIAEVYTLAPAVALYLNGVELDKKKTEHGIAKFGVTYQPGVLEARALDQNGKEISRSRLETHGKTKKILITPEKKQIRANGRDLRYLDIDITDENGNTVPYDDRLITITVKGAGTLAGFGSARPVTDERYDTATHTTYFGHAQAIIIAGKKPGDIEIELKADGLPDASITIKCVKS